jgi:hypothetical protein
MEVGHTDLAVHLQNSKAAGSTRQFVPSPEELPHPGGYMPLDGLIGLGGVAELKVFRPTRQQTVQPAPQLGPRGWIPRVQQEVDLVLEILLRFLRGLGRNDFLPGAPVPEGTEGVTQEVERLFLDMAQTRLAWMSLNRTPSTPAAPALAFA